MSCCKSALSINKDKTRYCIWWKCCWFLIETNADTLDCSQKNHEILKTPDFGLLYLANDNITGILRCRLGWRS